MGWFAEKYGKDAHPKMSIDTFDDLLTKYGEEQASEFLEDVQDGIYSEEQIRETYLDTHNKKEHNSDYELADFCRGGDLSDED